MSDQNPQKTPEESAAIGTETITEDRLPPFNDDGVVIRPALETLSQLRRGTVMDQLSVELNRVVNDVRDCSTNKPGSITLTLKVAPIKDIPDAVSIEAKVVGKSPEDPPEQDLMFCDMDGNLSPRPTGRARQGDIFPERFRD